MNYDQNGCTPILAASAKSPSVGLVITSCGRPDLLAKTLQSFGEFNTYPLEQVVLIEDGGCDHDIRKIAAFLKVPESIVCLVKNERNIGQMASIDRAYSAVTTEYIFHCEDDWEFLAGGFIEHSMEILLSDPKVVCVWLRAHDDTNRHPIDSEVLRTRGGRTYRLMQNGFRKVWSGFTFNPGLRRTVDCMRLHPYASQSKVDNIGPAVLVAESDISILYGRLGFRGAITDRSAGYVRHIGADQHIPNHWESKWGVRLKNLVRRLVKNV